MDNKDKLRQRRSAEDAAFNRMLLWLVGAVVAEIVVLLVKRFYVDTTAGRIEIALALSTVFKVFSFVGLVLTALGIVWCVLWKRGGKKLVLPLVCTVAVGFLWVLSVLSAVFYDTGVKVMTALPIVGFVLILIYFLYQRSFFTNAILTGCGMAALWMYRQFYAGHTVVVTLCFVVGWILLAAVAVLAWFMKKNGGSLGKMKLGTEQSSYIACWLTCAVVAVAMLLGFVLGSGLAYYLLYALVGWLFCLAVYYTVKLM